MSLYVGRLSPQTRREDLERVFWRFGRCNVQLKDGYGFVVYEVTANAERALRSMRGKIICGEHITLSWSNKQPRPFPKFIRPPRLHDSFRRREIEEDVKFSRSNEQEVQHTEGELEMAHETDEVDKHGSGTEEIRVQRENSLKDHVDEQDPVENGRWGEGFVDVVNEQGVENGADFDRYEPYHGYEKRDSSTSNRGKSAEKVDINHDKSKSQPTCYWCGLVGHIKLNCPQRDFRRDNFGEYYHRRDESNSRATIEGSLKRPRPAWDMREPGKFRKVVSRSRSPLERNIKSRQDSRKRRSKQEVGTKIKGQKKKRVRSGSSSQPSNSSTASSHSRSRSSRSRSPKCSRSASRSASSSSHSLSSSSKSAAIRSFSRSPGSRLRSSSPLSRSLSVSLDRKLPTAPENALSKSPDKEPEKTLIANLDTSKPKDILDDKNVSVPIKADYETGNKLQLVDGDGTGDSSSQIQLKETNLYHGDGVPGVPSRSDLQIESRSSVSNSRKITTQEVVMALRHYGVPAPTDADLNISVEGYFGAARLWPWQIIYYRRLRKGLITIENYARRVEQNKEFGIVDKYIRSSSGWGDLDRAA